MAFTYDKTYLPKRCTPERFREEVERHRAKGDPDCVEVLFFGDGMVLCVNDCNDSSIVYCVDALMKKD